VCGTTEGCVPLHLVGAQRVRNSRNSTFFGGPCEGVAFGTPIPMAASEFRQSTCAKSGGEAGASLTGQSVIFSILGEGDQLVFRHLARRFFNLVEILLQQLASQDM
jgi:hypothetical protein